MGWGGDGEIFVGMGLMSTTVSLFSGNAAPKWQKFRRGEPFADFYIYVRDLYARLRSTGIRGLMRGMASLPKGNQELLWSRNKVGRPPGELGVSKSMECDIFPSVL